MPLGLFNHPLFFAAAAVFAIGYAVYEIVSNQEEKRMQHRGRNNRRPPSPPPDPFTNRRRPPSPPPDPFTNRRRPPSPPSDPFTQRKRPSSPADSFTSCKSKSPSPPPDSSVRRRITQQSYSPDHSASPPPESYSPDHSASPPPESYSPDNNLIKHNVDKTSPKKSFPADLNVKKEEGTGSPACVKEQNQTASDIQNNDDKVFDEKNYQQNMLDRFTVETKQINQNLTKENNLLCNTVEGESDSSENNNLPKNEEKVINETTFDENPHTSGESSKKCLSNPNQGLTVSSSDSQSDISKNNLPLNTQKKKTKRHNSHSKASKTKDSSTSQSSCTHSETDSDSISSVKSAISSASSISKKDTNDEEELKSSKKKVHTSKRKCRKCSEKKVKDEIRRSNSCKAHDASSSRSACICSATLQSSRCSSSSVSDEDSNNKEVYEAQNPTSVENIEKDKLPKSEICEACLKDNINASFSPCNHSYLCTDCAVKFSRISKKCCKCDENIKSIQLALGS